MEILPCIKEVKNNSEENCDNDVDEKVPDKIGEPKYEWVDTGHHLNLLGIGHSLLEGKYSEDPED